MTKPHDRDSTIDNIHRTRERLAARFGRDIKAILADARRRQAESGHAVWQGKPAGKPSDGPRQTGFSMKSIANGRRHHEPNREQQRGRFNSLNRFSSTAFRP